VGLPWGLLCPDGLVVLAGYGHSLVRVGWCRGCLGRGFWGERQWDWGCGEIMVSGVCPCGV